MSVRLMSLEKDFCSAKRRRRREKKLEKEVKEEEEEEEGENVVKNAGFSTSATTWMLNVRSFGSTKQVHEHKHEY